MGRSLMSCPQLEIEDIRSRYHQLLQLPITSLSNPSFYVVTQITISFEHQQPLSVIPA